MRQARDARSEARPLVLSESVTSPRPEVLEKPRSSVTGQNPPSRPSAPNLSSLNKGKWGTLEPSEESVALSENLMTDKGSLRLSLPKTRAGRFTFIAAVGLCAFGIALVAGRSSVEALPLGIALAAMMTALFD